MTFSISDLHKYKSRNTFIKTCFELYCVSLFPITSCTIAYWVLSSMNPSWGGQKVDVGEATDRSRVPETGPVKELVSSAGPRELKPGELLCLRALLEAGHEGSRCGHP